MDKKRILLVDDEEAFAALLKMNLEQTGNYEVRVENRGKDAIPAARHFKPDLIVLDVIMPDISGREVADELKKDPDLDAVPIVFLTATISRDEVMDYGGIIGGHRSMAKPVSMPELLSCFEEALNP